MEFLNIKEGGYVTITQKELVKGTFVRIQPHSKTFLDISNPQAVLEKHLRSFSAMTKGIVFAFKYNDTTFKFNVLEVKPANAVSIIETDINVDFAPPLDYVEPKPIIKSNNHQSSPKIVPTIEENLSDSDDVDSDASSEEDIFFPGSGLKISGKPVNKESSSQNQNKEEKKKKTSMILGSSNSNSKIKEENKNDEKNEPKFIAFSGEGYSLKKNKK